MVKSESWLPQVGDLTWTRFDKSNARALGIVLRLPLNPPAEITETPSVYCELDLPDRYAIACLDGESHVYPPLYYLKPFVKEAALALRCMKVKSSKELSLWDREKRKSIKGALKFLESKESLKESHDFVNCPECCDEADTKFWETMGIERGDAHIKRKSSLESRRIATKKEVEERDRLIHERKEAAKCKVSRKSKKTENDDDSSSEEDSEESSDETSTGTSDDDSVESEVAFSEAESDSESVVVDEHTPKKTKKLNVKKTRSRTRRLNLDSSSSETEKESDTEEPTTKKRRKS